MTEYRTLQLALTAMRENFSSMGDLSGFESHAELVAAIRAIEQRMFDIVRNAI
jgi:hypothetical protein